MAQKEPRAEGSENRADKQNDDRNRGATGTMQIDRRNPDDLTPHPLNEDIYGDEAPDWFVETVDENGVEEPIKLIAGSHLVDGATEVIISGHRRADAAQQLDLEEVPVIVRPPYESELAEREALLEHNKKREKSFSQKMREAKELIEIERERAKERQQRGEAVGTDGEPQDFAEGETYEIVADRFDRSKQWLRYSEKVWDAQNDENSQVANLAERLIEQIDDGNESPHGAHERIKTHRKLLERSLSTTGELVADDKGIEHEDHPPVQASWLVKSSRLKRLLKYGRAGRFQWVYLEITTDEVHVVQSTIPGVASRLLSYCSFKEDYFEEFELAREKPVRAFIDVETITAALKRDDSDTARVEFRADDAQEYATGIGIVGEVEYWSRTDAIDDQDEVEAMLSRLPEDPHSRFDSQDVFVVADAQRAETRVKTDVAEIKKLMWAVDHTPGDDNYPLTIEGGKFRFHAGDETAYLEGRLDADVTGPDVSKKFGLGFEDVFNTLSGKVELQTTSADKPPLAVVQRNDDHVIRHVIAPT